MKDDSANRQDEQLVDIYKVSWTLTKVLPLSNHDVMNLNIITCPLSNIYWV